MISVERLPYTWGDIKNGKLGIDTNDASIMKEAIKNTIFKEKEKKFVSPALIPFFEEELRNRDDISNEKKELLR